MSANSPLVRISVADLADALGGLPDRLLAVLQLASSRGMLCLVGREEVLLFPPTAEALGLARDEAGRWSAASGEGARIPARPAAEGVRSAAPWVLASLVDSGQREPADVLAAGEPDPERLAGLLSRLEARLGLPQATPPRPVPGARKAAPGAAGGPSAKKPRAFDLKALRRELAARKAAAVG